MKEIGITESKKATENTIGWIIQSILDISLMEKKKVMDQRHGLMEPNLKENI